MTTSESQTTKEKILKAAKEIFVEKGKDGARMQEIADLAGVNKAMLFYYFNSKDLLYNEVLRSIIKKLFGKLNEIVISEVDPRMKIEQFVNAYINFIVENEEMPRIMLRELSSGGKVVSKIFREVINQGDSKFYEKFFSMIHDSALNKQFRNVDPIQTVLSILGMSLIFFIARPILSEIEFFKDIKQADFLEKRKKSIVDLLENGILLKEEIE